MRCQAETVVAKPSGDVSTAGGTAAARDFMCNGFSLLFSFFFFREVKMINKQIEE